MPAIDCRIIGSSLEVDENESVHVLKELNPHCVVVTNISRDQLDRYGEVDVVRNKLKEAISSVPDALLILNSDDVISYSLSMECGNPTARKYPCRPAPRR